jgi:hypothetical protein
MTPELPRWQVRASVAVLSLSLLATGLGLFRAGHYADPPALVAVYRTQDLTTLAVALPVLAVGLWRAVRGSLRGRLLWLGGLAYTTYVWFSVVLQVAYTDFFIGYVVLAGLSLFTLVGGVAGTDAARVRRAVAGRVRTRTYGLALLFVASGLAVLWLADLVPPLLTGETPLIVVEAGRQTLVSHALDLAVVAPGLAVAGVWLRRDRPWGYVFAGVLLVFGALLGVTVLAGTLQTAAAGVVTLSPVALVFTALPLVVSGLLAVRYLAALDPAGEKRGVESTS